MAVRLSQYLKNGQAELLNYWKRIFNRATVVVFTNYFLPVSIVIYLINAVFNDLGNSAEFRRLMCLILKACNFFLKFLQIMYSTFDTGNYFVIPSSAAGVWEAVIFLALHNQTDVRVNMGYKSEEFLIAIVGSQFEYSGMWVEHALVLQGLAPLVLEFSCGNSSSILKVGVLSGNSSSTYKMALKVLSCFTSMSSLYIGILSSG